ncbi:Circadian phase modifier [Planococcus halocryophilus Or1]|uniref:1-(5-phosphoribosyl)-5-amino-4-imidazole-carboxylate carboxylase n=1 Tax=Planococcus halocryophilus TaxID=1215089 RepID=A0A1C7DT25_9BACL|nr:nickel pincer cofactor biosynthesis protein LarB [Planococcus halocryophilus]ANU14554.1 1-(5-phosphoribosyl)-5-amino-4-imidazole-carboxylate carboxylase [Planococcus halocryophilus]EMF46726.1 Circadian phase modifier [Planococcus halocryophilus Or1]
MENFEDLGFSKVDYGREKRQGFPEVIYGEGKTIEQIEPIMEKLIEKHGKVMVTRLDKEKGESLVSTFPLAHYDYTARILLYGKPENYYGGEVMVVCAGTSDLFVAEEAAITAEWMGCKVKRLYDVGVAGIDRLLAFREEITNADVLIVIAGMEGALPSVIGGLVQRPVIAVPTSVGYGAHLQGITPLLAMLSSCSSGMSVVNIDNGFGAAYQAALILKLVSEGVNHEIVIS